MSRLIIGQDRILLAVYYLTRRLCDIYFIFERLAKFKGKTAPHIPIIIYIDAFLLFFRSVYFS